MLLSDISSIKLGTTKITKIYLGSGEIWTDTNYWLIPLTFEILTDGTIVWKHDAEYGVQKTIQYSTDEGNTWESITSSSDPQTYPTINVKTGDKICFKGANNQYGKNDGHNGVLGARFGGTAKFNLYGNVYSLTGTLPPPLNLYQPFEYQFPALFKNSMVVSAENLILPATGAVLGMYAFMFCECPLLETSPKIMLETLMQISTKAEGKENGTIQGMFRDCDMLTSIYMMSTTAPTARSAENFTYGVAAQGVFYQNDAATWSVVGSYGIPSGWDVIKVKP